MLHFYEYKLQNILKQGIQVRTLVLSSKITKVGLNNYKGKYENFLKKSNEQIKQQVYLHILDSMLGSNWVDEKIKQKKLLDLKNGIYNDRVITIMENSYKSKLIPEAPYPPQRPITRTVKEIFNILLSIYTDRVRMGFPAIDVQKEAIKQVEESGIIFLDEIDKLAVPQGIFNNGKGVSTEGVQRDLLPLLEGTVINTKFGDVRTDHILFIASGSFSMAKVQDLIPELLGRLPLRVLMNPITLEEFGRILREPQYNLLMQQSALLKMDDITLKFNDEAINQIARMAFEMNLNTENLGARRLFSIVEKVVEQVSFDSPKYKGQQFIVTKEYVVERLKGMEKKIQLDKFLI